MTQTYLPRSLPRPLETIERPGPPGPHEPSIIALENLDFSYGEKSDFRLRVARLGIRRRELIVIVGPNGGGKSTLAHIIGLLRSSWHQPGPDPFRLTIQTPWGPVEHPGPSGGDRASHRALAEVRNAVIGHLFQWPFLVPALDVLENATLMTMVRHGEGDAAEARERASRMLGQLGLPGREGSSTSDLSGGQRQLVSAVRTLAHDPEILICDEPTNHLDAEKRRRLRTLIRAEVDGGRAGILITHDIVEGLRLADRLWLVRDGELIFPAAGDPDDPEPDRPGPSGEARPSLRDEDALERLTREVTHYLSEESPGHSPALTLPDPVPEGEPWMAPEPAESAPDPVEEAKAPRLGLGRRVFPLAARFLTTRHQRAFHLLIALALVCGTAGFRGILDLARGVLEFVQSRKLGAEWSAAQVWIASQVRLDQETIARLGGLAGLRADPIVIEQSPVALVPSSGSNIDVQAFSVSPGGPWLAAADPSKRATAPVGAIYLRGHDFAKGDDRAGAIVTLSLLRKLVGPEVAAGDPGRWPTEIRASLMSDGTSRNPGFDGVVPIPIVGVIEYPDPVLGDARGGRLPELYLSQPLFDGVKRWRPELAFVLRRMDDGPPADSAPLIEPIKLVESVTIRPGLPAGDAVEVREALGEIVAELGGLTTPSKAPDGSIVLRLDPGKYPEQRIRPADFRQVAARLYRVFGASAAERIVVVTAPVTRFFRSDLPATSLSADDPQMVLLPFRNLGQLLQAFRSLDAEASTQPESRRWRVDCRNLRAIEQIEEARPWVGAAVGALAVAYFGGLAMVAGFVAAWTVRNQSAEIAILKVAGLSPASIGALYQVQVGLLVGPAVLIGALGERALAWFANDPVARLVAGLVDPGSGGATGGTPVVFACLQTGALGELTFLAILAGSVAAILALSSLLTIALIGRQDVLESLRGS